MDVQIESSWKTALKNTFCKPYFQELTSFLKNEKAAGKIIFPVGQNIFRAFYATPLSKVKVVILGQDPYHNPKQAQGLAFSVPPEIAPPPSLVNIFKELHTDIGMEIPKNGNLEHWAEQGVLLLNASLTVEANKANSHRDAGWHGFTDDVIHAISKQKDHVVFMLWGAFAKSKSTLIDPAKHLILTAAHPSPLSVHKGFFGCRHFSKANIWLGLHGIPAINWAPK